MTKSAIDDLLTLDDIETANDVEYAEVKAWGKTARIRSLTSEDMIEWREANEGEAKKTAGLRLIIKSLVNKDGVPLLEPRHLDLLKKRGEKSNNAIVTKILELNGLSQNDSTKKG